MRAWQEPLHAAGTGVVYDIWRSQPGGVWDQVGEVGGAPLTFVDETAGSGVNYQYEVTAVVQ